MKKVVLLVFSFLLLNSLNAQWNEGNYTISANHVSELVFPSQNAAYGVSGGELIKSTDQGANWTIMYDEGPFSSMSNLSFVNADTGFVKSWSTNLRTMDGGVTWDAMSWFYDIKIVDDELFASYASNDTAYIITSTDYGDSWTVLFENYDIGASPYHISFLDNQTAYFMTGLNLDEMYYTSDGFNSIDTTISTFGDMQPQQHMHFTDSLNGYFYGSWGAQSRPARTWFGGVIYFPIDLDGFGVLPVLDASFHDGVIYAGSLYGKIFYSLNKGQYWFEQDTPMDDPIVAISFLDENVGICSTGDKIYYISNATTLGVDDQDDHDLKLYPIPTDGLLNVELNGASFNSFELFDFQGRRQDVQFELMNDKIIINISMLPAGNYVLDVKSNKEKRSYQIVKK